MCREWRSLMGREVFLRIMQLGKEKGKDRLIFHISFSIFHFHLAHAGAARDHRALITRRR